MLQQPVSHSRRFNSGVETRSIGVVARVTTGHAGALSTSMGHRGEPAISTGKGTRQQMQNGSEFPELVAENSRTHKRGGKPATLRVNEGGAVLAADGNEILGCVGKNSD